MRRVELATDLPACDFLTAKSRADEVAAEELIDPICLSWVDSMAGTESPAHASECHDDCDIPGAVEYAINRGAELEIVVDGGTYIFCYRSPGEFANL
jgi:hypothetical protein